MYSRQRYVVIGAVILSALFGAAVAHGLQWLWVYLSWDDPFPLGVRELPLTSLIAYGLAVGVLVFILRHQPTLALANEVVDELSKVSWPTREETGNATVVVIITVLITSAFLGVFDAVWLRLTDWILGIEQLTQG
jgi:preprotein translocase SecE subunit